MKRVFLIAIMFVASYIIDGVGWDFDALAVSRQWISPLGDSESGITPAPINHTEYQQKLKEQNWETFYSQENRFALDYPNYNGKANITERV